LLKNIENMNELVNNAEYSNLQYMRLLYSYYPIRQTLSGKLSWSHYVELISVDEKVKNESARNY